MNCLREYQLKYSCVCFFLLLQLVIDGYVRTYADDHYGRIRGSEKKKGIDGSIIFLIIFGCIIGGFFILCILGTFIFGFFDSGRRCFRNISFISPNHSNV